MENDENNENFADELLDIDYEKDLSMTQRDLGDDNLLENDDDDELDSSFSKSEQELLDEVIGSESPDIDEDYDNDLDEDKDYLADDDLYNSPIEDSISDEDKDNLLEKSVESIEEESFTVEEEKSEPETVEETPVEEEKPSEPIEEKTEEVPEEPQIPADEEEPVEPKNTKEIKIEEVSTEEAEIPKQEEVKEETSESDKDNEEIDDDGSFDDSDSDEVRKPPVNADKFDVDGNIIETKAVVDNSSIHDNIPKGTPADVAREIFANKVNEILATRNRDDLLKYLKKYKEEDDETYSIIINDLYTKEMALYGEYIDFKNDPNARQSLWIIVSAKFADYIERQKQTGEIKSTAEIVRRGNKTGDQTIEDENLAAIREYKNTESNKYNKYALDRTVFEIANDDEDDSVSIFDERVSAQKEFYEGPFYPILKEVITTDDLRFCDMSNVQMKVTIGPQTSWYPIVDFSTGYRIVCVDTEDVNQFRMNPGIVARKVKWPFGRHPFGEYRIRVLYSDNCKAQPAATIFALKKTVAFEYWDKHRVLTLNGKYVLAYTTDPKYVKIFENGDLDDKALGNSTYYRSKPHTHCVGVIAIDKKSLHDRRMARRNQIRNAIDPYQNELNINDYDIHFILSARYIRNDRTLTDPTRTPEQRYVQYTITQFTESKAIIPMDGFQTIIACIIKEHQNVYGPGVQYSIDIEIDRDNLPSPSVMDIIYSLDGVEKSNWRRTKDLDLQTTFCLPPSRAKLEGVFEFERGRIDSRIFSPATIQRQYDESLWRNYNLSTIDGRNEFIRSRGFEVFTSPAIDVYDIMPYALNTLATSSIFTDLIKVDMATLGDRDSADRENLLYKQQKLEYFKQLEGSGEGTLQKFIISAFDWLVDTFIGN